MGVPLMAIAGRRVWLPRPPKVETFSRCPETPRPTLKPQLGCNRRLSAPLRHENMDASFMRTAAIAAVVLCLWTGQAAAVDPRIRGVLMRTEPDTRLEQVCDIEAIRRIGREQPYKPDRAKSDILEHPRHAGDFMSAPGAAFRSRGRWYGLAFECKGTPDHLDVLSFSYRVGTLIPASRWDELGLWR